MNKQYAALIESSYHVEGDERSKTNPGHGYPAHIVSYTEVQKFSSREEMQEWVEEEESRAYLKRAYEIIEYVPMKVRTSFVIKVE